MCSAGITPAHAGKTKQVDRFAHCFRDHPRACGENFQRAESEKARLGSPPRMRGKRCVLFNHDRDYGITPAHAGKTNRICGRETPHRDHPRACGENFLISWNASLLKGSPPRMRGKLNFSRSPALMFGITPAHAGKTRLPHQMRQSARDHPRACGENDDPASRRTVEAGSPPRMRGKPPSPPRRSAESRITPAHAGKTYNRQL